MITLEQAQAELKELRGLAERGNDLAFYHERVDRLYMAVCHKRLRVCNCKNVEKDALIEIYQRLKILAMSNEKLDTAARLVNGVVLKVDGNHYTNANLTDEIARRFLAEFPQRADWFAQLPPEKGENTSEEPANEPKSSRGATTPKKKKSANKRN